MIKIAVLYICTGKYNQFFKGFYESAEKYLLKGLADITYFVWTDNIDLTHAANVHLIERQCQGFPKDSLFRFDMFLSIKEKLEKFDYIFFFNANMSLVQPVGEEILPKEEGLMAVLHPTYFRRWPACCFPYERNKRSTAYIAPHGENYHYFMGSLNGGKANDFLQMAQTLSFNTHKDWDKGIVAQVHDESHLNKYMRTHNCKVIPSAYAYPEGWHLPFKPKIILRDKVKIDSYFNKGRDKSPWGKCKMLLNIIKRSIIWYL